MTSTLYHPTSLEANATDSTADELNTLNAVTAGTVTASKALVVDANKDLGTFRNVAMAALTATTGTFSGAISGTTVTGTGIGQFSQIKAREFVLAMAVNGAVTIPAYSQTIYFTKGGVCAATIVDPTATTHDGVRLTFVNTTANANTIDNSAGSGFNQGGAGSDVATSAAAIGDYLIIEAYQGKWYVVGNSGYTLA